MKKITLEKALLMLEEIDHKQLRSKFADIRIRCKELEEENSALKMRILKESKQCICQGYLKKINKV